MDKEARMDLAKGTAATKEFYDRQGWQPQDDGKLLDWALFAWGDSPVQNALDLNRKRRICEMVRSGGLDIIELACGANPAVFLARECASYTAVDFLPAGLAKAKETLDRAGIPCETVEADITNLPFYDERFDLAYSAQAIYHIDTAEGQAEAFNEAMRVLRPGGRAIFVLANPFPILFPYRTFRRALAMTPGVKSLLNRLRRKPVLPYLPMPLGWMKRKLPKWGSVTITGYAISTVDFSRNVSEATGIGSLVWRAIAWLETKHPNLVARLGNYVIVVVDKKRA